MAKGEFCIICGKYPQTSNSSECKYCRKKTSTCPDCGAKISPSAEKCRTCSNGGRKIVDICSTCGRWPRMDNYPECKYCHRKILCPECGENKMTDRSEMCRSCSDKIRVGPRHTCWKGGRVETPDGYIRIYKTDHHRTVNNRYVLEHILVMEDKLGRPLYKDEEVHHKNLIRNDNRSENLELWSGSHPAGARVIDLVQWAYYILDRYEDEVKNNLITL